MLHFEEFHDKTKSEDQHKKETGDLPFAFTPCFPKEHENHERNKIKSRFIELHGMARSGKTAVSGMAEEDGPRDIGDSSQNFLVDEVAHADADGGKRRGDDDQIEQAQIRKLLVIASV